MQTCKVGRMLNSMNSAGFEALHEVSADGGPTDGRIRRAEKGAVDVPGAGGCADGTRE